jgi:hypothetical protein
VDEVVLSKTIVARVTHLRIVTGASEFVPYSGLKGGAPFLGYVTDLALMFRHRLMDLLVLRHPQVTTRRGAGRPAGGGR